MSEPSFSRPFADRNLLYGMLALQVNYVGRNALLAAMQTWVFDKTKSFGAILQEQGKLTAERREAIERMLAEHLKAHNDDPHQSLAALSVPPPVRQDLNGLADQDVQASLAAVADPERTHAYVPAEPSEHLRYKILRPHARGGLGEISIALDEELQREVALKEILPRFADNAEGRGRFLREAAITGGLEHPGIVPVYGLGQHADGRPYYAMRFIQGATLKEAIRKLHTGDTSVTLRALLIRFVAVCNAVAYAHSRGVLHRDLKPANIMLGKFGETLVLDWGLAKAGGQGATAGDSTDPTQQPLVPQSGESSVETQMGSAIGTPAYMSPEQASGHSASLGPPADVYGLGATLYTVLTGKAPVEGRDSFEILEKVRRGDWLPPQRVNGATPLPLDAICQKAMAVRPEDRYPTALALAADLEAWLADEPVAAYREPRTTRALRWMRRHQKLVTGAAAVVLVTALALGLGVVLLSAANEREHDARQHAENAEQDAKRNEEDARLQGEAARRQRDAARQNLYVANLNLAQREWESGNVAHVLELLAESTPRQPDETDLRGWEWHYQERLCHSSLRTLRGHAGEVRCVGISPDGSRIASGGEDGTVRLWETATGKEVQCLKPLRSRVLAIAFSPDGKQLAFGGDEERIRLWDVADGREKLVFPVSKTSTWGLAFTADGQRLASANHDARVRLWDARTGTLIRVLEGNAPSVEGVSFSPDGTRLAATGSDGIVRVWDADAGSLRSSFHGLAGWGRCVAISPDGASVAAGGEDWTVRLWDLSDGRLLRTLKDHTARVHGITFTPDGRWLASASEDGTVRLWDVAGGSVRRIFKGHTGEIYGLACSRDGTRLVSAGKDGTVRVWDTASEGSSRLFHGHQGEVNCVAYAPDCSRFASGGEDGSIHVWDPAENETRVLVGHKGLIYDLAFSPDGKYLASGGSDQSLRLWDPATGRLVRTLIGHPRSVRSVTFSLDSQQLYSGCSDGQLRLWDVASGQLLHAWAGHTEQIRCIALSRDGLCLVSAGEDSLVRIWDVASRKPLHVLKGHASRVYEAAFSPDGAQVVSCSRDGSVRFWDVAHGTEMRQLRGHTGWVTSVVFSPDGARLASAGDDGTVRLWDAPSGTELRVLRDHTGWVHSVAFSPDGTRLVSGGADGTVRLTDGRPWTPSQAEEDEARCLVEGFLARPLLKADVLRQVRDHKGISDAVRAQALELANHSRDEAERFYRAGRDVVRHPEAPKPLHSLALGWAQTALHLSPGSGPALATLGIAHYRLGQDGAALEALAHAEAGNQVNEPELLAVLAFQSLALHRLERIPEAKARLELLRARMEKAPASWNAEAAEYLAEAEQEFSRARR